MTHAELIAELQRLFAKEKDIQWRIGDLLIQEVGPPGADGSHNGSRSKLQEIADELGVNLDVLFEYRRMAATFPPAVRTAGTPITAYKVASRTKAPLKVLAEAEEVARRAAQRKTQETGQPQEPKVTPTMVREIAVKPEYRRPPEDNPKGKPNWGRKLTTAMNGATGHLRDLVRLLEEVGPDEELSEGCQRDLTETADRCESHIAWIRAFQRGEEISDEITAFLQTQAD